MTAALRIELLGLRTTAIIGVLPEEQTRAQPLEFDIVLHLNSVASTESDDLFDTVDYGAVCSQVIAHAENNQYQLLERLAGATTDELLATFPLVQTVDLTVRKLRPPVPEDLASSGVSITRERS